MKTLNIGDTHVRPYGEYSPFDSSFQTNNLLMIEKTYDWIIRIIKKGNIERVIHYGDLYDDNGVVDPVAKNFIDTTIYYAFRDMASMVPGGVYVLEGNHDRYTSDGSLSLLANLETIPNLHLIRTPQIIDGEAFIPYTRDYESVYAMKAEVAHTHLDFLGAHMTPKIKGNVGCRVDLIPFKVVYNGHYHHPSKIVQDDLTIHNLGAPYCLDHTDNMDPGGDLNISRGVWVSEGTKLERHYSNPHTPYYLGCRTNNMADILDLVEVRDVVYDEPRIVGGINLSSIRLKVLWTSPDPIPKEVYDLGVESVKVIHRPQLGYVQDALSVDGGNSKEVIPPASVDTVLHACIDAYETDLDKEVILNLITSHLQ